MDNISPFAAEIKHSVYEKLHALSITFRSVSHTPAASIEQCAAVESQIGATIPKNYFLTTKNQKHFFLCIVRPNARLRTADISKQVNSSRLSFAPEELLFDRLCTRPGSVSPMGLLFDSTHQIRLLVDRALLALPELAFHPCDNTETLSLSTADFFDKFLPEVGHVPEWIEIHDFLD